MSKKYLIRNEGVLPIQHFKLSNLLERQKGFLFEFENLVYKYTEYNIDIADVSEQIRRANIDLEGKNTISIDSFYQGTYNLEVSRVFEDKGLQFKPLYLSHSPNCPTLDKQIRNIDKSKKYILVDDDSVSGTTINYMKKLLGDIIEDYYFLAENTSEKYFDVIDLRDFIIGAKNGGLVVETSKGIDRVSYLYPRVNLETRASICLSKCESFSKEVIELNKKYFNYMEEGNLRGRY